MSKNKKRLRGIYGILCEPERKWYVGASVNIFQRFSEHLRNATVSPEHSHLYVDMQRHGVESFSTHILERVELTEDLPSRERFWQRMTESRSHGYNQQAGGRHRDW